MDFKLVPSIESGFALSSKLIACDDLCEALRRLCCSDMPSSNLRQLAGLSSCPCKQLERLVPAVDNLVVHNLVGSDCYLLKAVCFHHR